MDPLLITVPERIETPRLVLRPPRAGDGPAVNEGVLETIEQLQMWMPWSRPTPTVEQSEAWCRKGQANFLARTDLPILLLDKETGAFVGGSGLHAIDWTVPRFEIGYWVRRRCTGQGYVTEAVHGITAMAFDALNAERVEIRMDDNNRRSWRVAERTGFQLEGIIRNDNRGPDGSLRNLRVYSKIRRA